MASRVQRVTIESAPQQARPGTGQRLIEQWLPLAELGEEAGYRLGMAVCSKHPRSIFAALRVLLTM